MAKKPRPEGKKYNYMDTYGDLVTLLMCFFVLLFAMSTIEEDKYNAFAQAMQTQFGTPTETTAGAAPPATSQDESLPRPDASAPPQGDIMAPEQNLPQDFTQLSQAIEKYVNESELQGSVQVVAGENGTTFIRVQDNLLFDGDSSVIRPEAEDFLNFLGECFVLLEDQIYQANFIGHTASIAGSGVDDWTLSSERSGGVASYFQRVVGFPAGKMQTTGYGKNYPIGDNQTAEGRAKNRRVDIVVISNETDNLLQALAEASRVYFPDDTTEFYEGDPADLPSTALDNLPALVNADGLSTSQLQNLDEALNTVREGNAAASASTSSPGAASE